MLNFILFHFILFLNVIFYWAQTQEPNQSFTLAQNQAKPKSIVQTFGHLSHSRALSMAFFPCLHPAHPLVRLTNIAIPLACPFNRVVITSATLQMQPLTSLHLDEPHDHASRATHPSATAPQTQLPTLDTEWTPYTKKEGVGH